jgi:hypothetical protein
MLGPETSLIDTTSTLSQMIRGGVVALAERLQTHADRVILSIGGLNLWSFVQSVNLTLFVEDVNLRAWSWSMRLSSELKPSFAYRGCSVVLLVARFIVNHLELENVQKPRLLSST